MGMSHLTYIMHGNQKPRAPQRAMHVCLHRNLKADPARRHRCARRPFPGTGHWVCLSQGSQVKAVEASNAEVTPAVKGSVFLGCQAWPLLFPLLGVALPFSCRLFSINSTSRAAWTGPGREGATPLKGFHGASGGGACALTEETWG